MLHSPPKQRTLNANIVQCMLCIKRADVSLTLITDSTDMV